MMNRGHAMPVNGSGPFASGESRVHADAKAALLARRTINLPAYVNPPWPVPAQPSYRGGEVGGLADSVRANMDEDAEKPLLESRVFVARSVELEVQMAGFRVDALLDAGDEQLLVEIRNSNPVSEEKQQLIVATGKPCVEVDVSKLPENIDAGDLSDRVTGFGDHRCPMKWIFHPEGEDLARAHHQEMQAEFDRRFDIAKKDLVKTLRRKMGAAVRKLVHHPGFYGSWVEGCPLHVYKGQHSARFLDCSNCEHNLVSFVEDDDALLKELTGSHDRHVWCGCTDETAREYRAELMKDMEILHPKDAIRIAWEDGEIALPPELFDDMEWCGRFIDAHPECRNCGKSHMRLRQNRTTGEIFWGCGNWPRCDEAFGYETVAVLKEAMRFRGAEQTPAWHVRMKTLDRAEAERKAMEKEAYRMVMEADAKAADEAIRRRLGL